MCVMLEQGTKVLTCHLAELHSCFILQRGHWMVPDSNARVWVACDSSQQGVARLVDGCW